MKQYLLPALFLGFCSLLSAQIVTVPLPENPALRGQPRALSQPQVRKNPVDTIAIPFLDDFNQDSPYPSPKYWADAFAYINKGFGVNPITVGVATLDGLNAEGEAYANSGSGLADFLTSKPIFLGDKNTADNVFLSFFVQPQGFGDRPEVQDSLVVEFKDNQGKWVSMLRIAGVTAGGNAIQPFAPQAIAINQARFLYDGFQFRFKNYANLTGSLDHWHLDYVRITESITPSAVLNDVAFMKAAERILEKYTAMPWRHFRDNKATELNESYRVELFNHFNATQNINPSKVLLTEAATNTVILEDNILSFNELPIALGNIPIGNHVVNKAYSPTQLSTTVTNLSLFDTEETLKINSYFIANPSNQDGTLAATLRNDTAFSQTIFSDYFAYDDGGAELALVAGRLGDEVAVRFRANVPDTLRAIQFFIPRITGDVSGQRFNLKVWVGSLNSTPVFQLDFVRPIYVDSLQGWTTYSLDTTPVALPVGEFFIGWQQALNAPTPNQAIPIGYDRNNNDKVINNFMNIGDGWQPLNSGTATVTDGALMIRAIVGENTPFTSATQPQPTFSASVFPNPTNDLLYFNLDAPHTDYDFRIFNLAGQTLQNGILTPSLSVGALPQGMYFVQLRQRNTGAVWNGKFLKY